jgi:hypothetical protein
MKDAILPAECLVEWKLELAALENGTAIFPPSWGGPRDLPRVIAETKEHIKELENWIDQHGNVWSID